LHYRIIDDNINNPTYSGDPRGISTKLSTIPGCEEHIYDAIGQSEKEEKQMEVKNKRSSNHYENAPKQPKNDDNADRDSIVSDDVLFDDTGEYCKPDVKETKAQYSKNGKLKPQPKPRHSTKPTATTGAAIHYDIPVNNHPVSADVGGEYASLSTTYPNTVNTDNNYQDLIVQPPPPPGYAVPTNIPATSATLDGYTDH